VQVRTAPIRRAVERTEETLLIEWPEGEAEPSKYWLSTLDKNISFRRLVDIAKMRWRVERDYQELKQEVGLGHYEVRSWRGFHHHGTLCIAIYGFLVSERETIPPSGPGSCWTLKRPALPNGYRHRGAADPTPTTRPPTRSRPYIADWSSRSPELCRDAHVARAASQGAHAVPCDAVILCEQAGRDLGHHEG
jgi:hypothetical protein